MVMQDDYRQFFHAVTGFQPTAFQEAVAQAVLAERNVILRAPTGSGKTWAVVVPFLYAYLRDERIADRLLYALPLRSLATSLYESTQKAVSECDQTRELQKRVRIQTGEQKDDSLFEGLATFCTIDQLLSGYLLHPVGLPKRTGNINAGAILGALVCFDEFHLLEPEKSMATTIEMLHTMTVTNPLSRFVLMTATLSDATMAWLGKNLNAELIEVSAAEVEQLHSHKGKIRNYRWLDEPLSAAAVAAVHDHGKSIVIANTVNRAQALYEELQEEVCRQKLGPDTQIRLLHSRFLPDDRRKIEKSLAGWFGPNSQHGDIILVATQVIEAGLDFSCENLHTEVAPMNSVIQRAGRCARRQGEVGTVWCYPVATNANGNPAYGPYRDVASLVDETSAALQESFGHEPRAVPFHDELNLVNRVHTEWELNQLKPLESIYAHRQLVRKAMDGDDPAAVRNLIRDVSSVNVIITDQPESLNFNKQTWPEMISVPPTSLYQLFDRQNPPGGGEWIAKTARELDVFQGGALDIKWEALTSANDIASISWIVAIHPSRATYRDDLGLLIGQGGPAPTVQYRDRPKYDRYSYTCEPYPIHIRRVCDAGERRNADYRVIDQRLSRLLGISENCLSDWRILIYRLHDVGKLSVEWQNAIWKWQEQKTDVAPDQRVPLAHSDYNPATDRGLKVYPRPPHAAEGAYAVCNLLSTFGGDNYDIARAALTAIVRHHGPFTSSLGAFELISEATQIVAETLRQDTIEPALCDRPSLRMQQACSDYLVQATSPDHAKALLLYLYFVRRLRIADQNSFAEP